MSANKLIRAPLWATLLTALVAAMVVLFVFVQSGQAAPAADEGPSAAKSSYQIVGGKPVPDGKYHFMVFLDFYAGPNLTYGGYCGGTLIDKDSVLTAAHCFYDPITRENLLEKDRFLVAAYIGLTVRSNQSQGQFRIVRRASIHIHQDFNLRRNYRYDAAVLELSRPVSGITPIKLATLSQNDLEKPGRDATIAGWGNTIANVGGGQPPEVPGGPATPDRMHEAQVPIVSDFRADQILNDFAPKDPDQYGPSLMIAAGGKGKDACQGDSGGPLFSALESDGNGDNGDGDNGDGDNGDDNNRHDTNGGPGGKYTQIGITSSGFGCGQKTPGVYTEVNNPFVRSFITNVASK